MKRLLSRLFTPAPLAPSPNALSEAEEKLRVALQAHEAQRIAWQKRYAAMEARTASYQELIQVHAQEIERLKAEKAAVAAEAIAKERAIAALELRFVDPTFVPASILEERIAELTREKEALAAELSSKKKPAPRRKKAS
jgi:predicted  nucleic acid-binding Zn-ribbon protein